MTEPDSTAPAEPQPGALDLDSLLAGYAVELEEQRSGREVVFEVTENRARGLLPMALRLRAMDREAVARCSKGRDVDEANAAIVAAATRAVYVEVQGQWQQVGESWDSQLAGRFRRPWVSGMHLVRDLFVDDIALAAYADDYGRWLGLVREGSREVVLGEASASST